MSGRVEVLDRTGLGCDMTLLGITQLPHKSHRPSRILVQTLLEAMT